jgi:hypothetical protein
MVHYFAGRFPEDSKLLGPSAPNVAHNIREQQACEFKEFSFGFQYTGMVISLRNFAQLLV